MLQERLERHVPFEVDVTRLRPKPAGSRSRPSVTTTSASTPRKPANSFEKISRPRWPLKLVPILT